MQDNLQLFLTKEIMRKHLASTNCLSLLVTSFETDNIELVNTVCDKFNNSVDSDEFIVAGIRACRDKYQKDWQYFVGLGVSEMQIESFCDETVTHGFGFLYDAVRVKLNDFYKCDKTPNKYCSDYELALKQWANSTVTQNIPE